VLDTFDAKNQKALFRRAHAFKTQEKWEEAVRDLQLLMKEAPADPIKKDLDFCMGKFVEARTKKAAEPKPKITEVVEDKTQFKKVQISEESSEDSDDAEALQAKKVEAQAKKQLDQEALEAARAKASEQEKASLMGNLPKTAAGFEKDFNALKKDKSALVEYMKRMPLPTLEGYFKRAEVPVEVL
jgi:hypothetical protein